MDKSQRELRNAAAQAFMESLNQLEKTLLPVDGEALEGTDTIEQPALPLPTAVQPDESVEVVSALTVAELEAAAADIEAFIQGKQES